MKRTLMLLPSLVFFTACCVYVEKTETVTFTIEEDFAILYVETINGNIDINTSDDNDTDIDATVEMFAYACTEDDALEYLDQITINKVLVGDTYKIIIEFPDNNISCNFNAYGGAHLSFDNLKDKQVILKTLNGNIECEEIIGGTIETVNGEVYVKNAEDTIEIGVGNGNVECEEITGGTIETTNGDVHVKNSEDTIAIDVGNGIIECEEITGGIIETVNGAVHVKKVEDTIEIKLGNGSIEVEEFLGGEFNLETKNGSISIEDLSNGAVDGTLKTTTGKISLVLSQDLSCNVELKTNNGSIELDGVEHYERERSFLNEELKFTLNEGEGQIIGSTINGSIDVAVY